MNIPNNFLTTIIRPTTAQNVPPVKQTSFFTLVMSSRESQTTIMALHALELDKIQLPRHHVVNSSLQTRLLMHGRGLSLTKN